MKPTLHFLGHEPGLVKPGTVLVMMIGDHRHHRMRVDRYTWSIDPGSTKNRITAHVTVLEGAPPADAVAARDIFTKLRVINEHTNQDIPITGFAGLDLLW